MKRHVVLLLCGLLIVGLMVMTTGCSTTAALRKAQGIGAVKGDLARQTCDGAWEFYQEENRWPNAAEIDSMNSLRVHNHFNDTEFAVYVLDKPYHKAPDTMDLSQTFRFFGHASPDSGHYVYCGINYDKSGKGGFVASAVEGDLAAIYSMKLDAEDFLIRFFAEASQSDGESKFKKVVKKYAVEVSEISPNPTAKQVLFDYTNSLLMEYYWLVVDLDHNGSEFQEQFDRYTMQLGEYLHNQDWLNF